MSIANVFAKNVVLANKVDRTQATAFKVGSNNHWARHQELEFNKFVRKQDIAYKKIVPKKVYLLSSRTKSSYQGF